MDEASSVLKKTFMLAREEQNIKHVFPVFLATQLYVVMIEESEGQYDFFYNPAPNPDNIPDSDKVCVTVTENLALLDSLKWPKIPMTGLELVKKLSEDIEIVIAYQEEGDYLTKNDMSLLREYIDEIDASDVSD